MQNIPYHSLLPFFLLYHRRHLDIDYPPVIEPTHDKIFECEFYLDIGKSLFI